MSDPESDRIHEELEAISIRKVASGEPELSEEDETRFRKGIERVRDGSANMDEIRELGRLVGLPFDEDTDLEGDL